MHLIYHHGWPYTCKACMLALEHGLIQHIAFQKAVVCPILFPVWSDNNEAVAVYNPMVKIPCLVPEVMSTLHACADGIMDAAVLITCELHIRKRRGLKFDDWIEGQKVKILGGLDRFEAAASGGVLRKPVFIGSPPGKEWGAAEAVSASKIQYHGSIYKDLPKQQPEQLTFLTIVD
ncbi:hypothetical protein CC80DRAFT_596486 [Byssothecium circinans]|uniref:Uncharacterized protein n=1 Tax=Byssothecium circinans TaxID=147558 RepID=A0A6A5TUU2_9PLEO|nr:hypothetical protein CC80DRAFT_596486 [Byssothecium circinans]